jgi:hypothetical protein
MGIPASPYDARTHKAYTHPHARYARTLRTHDARYARYARYARTTHALKARTTDKFKNQI